MNNIKLVQQTKTLLAKGHKPCKDFVWGCFTCQKTLLLNLLDHEIGLMKWVAEGKKSLKKG